jgi:hypothetical protein
MTNENYRLFLPDKHENGDYHPNIQKEQRRSNQVKIHHWTLGKKYLRHKAAYGYERFCVPVPKQFQNIVRPFAGKDVKIKIEPHEDGFTMQVNLSSRPKTPSSVKNDGEKPSRTP